MKVLVQIQKGDPPHFGQYPKGAGNSNHFSTNKFPILYLEEVGARFR